MNTDNQTAEIIRDLARDSEKIITLEKPDIGLHIAKVKSDGGEGDGDTFIDLEQYTHRDKPARLMGNITVHDVATFTNFYNDYKLPASRIYFDKDATPVPGRFVAHLNHPTKDEPAFADHQVFYPLRYSEAWKTWSGFSGKEMGQKAFGQFLEDNLSDIAETKDLLDAVFNFQAVKTMKVSQATRMRDGTVSFEFIEDMKDMGKVKLPETFQLAIPVFFNDKEYTIDARIRFVVPDDGQLKLRYEIIRPERIIDTAIADVVQAVQTLSDVTVLYGRRS